VLLLADLERMRRECRESAEMGCTGWITIHPSQIDVVHEACFPTAAEIAESRELVAAFEENKKLGKWAFSGRSIFLDYSFATALCSGKIVDLCRMIEQLDGSLDFRDFTFADPGLEIRKQLLAAGIVDLSQLFDFELLPLCRAPFGGL
jgi:hypothetical protein